MDNFLCQSCGMPLYNPDIYGTAANGLPIEDYCIYCYKDGGFTLDVTMDEMMRLCANYVEGGSKEFYIANMKTLYPHLKRWAKKEDTQNEYYKSINRVLEYVKDNLQECVDLKTLAGIANISPYHFHRMFKAVIGESVADYVTRLRMERAAEYLKSSPFSMAEIAERVGYSSEQALSRAFKKYFNLPPKTFRNTFFMETFGGELSPRVCKVSLRNIIIIKESLPNNKRWQKLYMYAMVNRLLSEITESIEAIIGQEYVPAISTDRSLESDKHIEAMALSEGIYSIFTHKGELERIPALYEAINNYWLPKSKYRLGDGIPYIVYLNNPSQVLPQDILVEIYIPLADKR